MSFPTIVYKCPGSHQCRGSSYSYKSAADESALAGLLAAGWFRTLPEAMAGESVQIEDEDAGDQDDNAPPTRAELEAMAAELGIKFDGRTTDAGLLKKINAELEAK